MLIAVLCFTLLGIAFGLGLTPRDFDQNSLKRAR